MPRKPSLKKQQEMKIADLEASNTRLNASLVAMRIDSLRWELKYREEQAAHTKAKLDVLQYKFAQLTESEEEK